MRLRRFFQIRDFGGRPVSGGIAAVLLVMAVGVGQSSAGADDPILPPRRLSGPRELLDLYGIDASQLALLVDGEPLGSNDEETLVRILYRLPRFLSSDLERWRRRDLDWSAFLDAPAERRADVVQLSGRVKKVERVSLLPEAAERFEFDHYFRLAMQLDDAPYPVIICTRVIPSAWSPGGAIDERSRAQGLFLKVGETIGQYRQLAFAAPRAEWLPDRVDESRRVWADHVYLGKLGMDAGLLDDVRRRNRKPMGEQDRECFYQLLAAVSRADPNEFGRLARGAVDLAVLLQEPEQVQGRIMVVEGTARRVTRVFVGDEEVRQRFGIDHYFQIDLFIPLGDYTVRLGKAKPGRDAPTFTNSYPVSVCVPSLPDELPESDELRQDVRIPAVYFKLWAYRSQFVAAFDRQQLQVSPMFVGLRPTTVRGAAGMGPYFGLAVSVVFLIALAGIWFGLWRSSRGDAQFERRALRRRFELPQGKSLNDATIEARDEPDFSDLP